MTMRPWCALQPLILYLVCFIWFLGHAQHEAMANDFRVTSLKITNSDITLSWNAPGGSNYVVQSAFSLPAPGLNAFFDISPALFVSGTNVQATNYTHFGAMFGSRTRFYRIRSFPIPTLQNVFIFPTNAAIGRNMTNRYKVFAVYSDNQTNDITADPGVTVTSLNTTVATVAGVTTNNYRLVHGRSVGTASLRAIYQGKTNTAALTVGRIMDIFTVPATLPDLKAFVEEETVPVKVFGVFADGRTNNITSSCIVESFFGGPTPNTRMDYKLPADVANAFALITGLAAAAEDLVIAAQGETNQAGARFITSKFHVNWCWFYDMTVSPEEVEIDLNGGSIQSVTLNGFLGNSGGTQDNLRFTNIDSFQVRNSAIASVRLDIFSHGSVYAVFFNITGRAAGSTVLDILVNNGPGTCAPILLSVPIRVVP